MEFQAVALFQTTREIFFLVVNVYTIYIRLVPLRHRSLIVAFVVHGFVAPPQPSVLHRPVGQGLGAAAVELVVHEFALVLGAVLPREHPLAVEHAVHPVPRVGGPRLFRGPGALAVHLARVKLPTKSVPLVGAGFRHGNGAIAIHEALDGVARVDRRAAPRVHGRHVVDVVGGGHVRQKVVLPPKAGFQDLAVRPSLGALAVELVVEERARVFGAVGPGKDPFAVERARLPVARVLGAAGIIAYTSMALVE